MYRLLTLEQVHIAQSRQRTSIDPTALQELANSIRDNHLLHAIVIDSDGNLIAGERRYRAITLLNEMGEDFYYGQKKVPQGFIPAVDVGSLSEVERYELELEENVRRADLTWQEQVTATARLAELKTELALAAGEAPPSMGELTVMVTELSSVTDRHGLRDHLDLARNLDKPEVRTAKTQKEALKALKKIVRAENHAQLAAEVGETYGSGAHSIFHANAKDWMKAAAPGQFDVILTDPPYGMGADQFGDSGGMAAGAHGYEDSPAVLNEILNWFPEESFRVTKPSAHLYVFCDIAWLGEWQMALVEAGWKVFRTPLIWNKINGMRAPWPEHGPRRNYELIVYAMKGDRKVTSLYPDVIPATADENLGHAAQKPVNLYIDLLQRSVLPGDRVLDCFCGSGVIFPAATHHQVHAVGIEMDDTSYGIAAERLKGLKGE